MKRVWSIFNLRDLDSQRTCILIDGGGARTRVNYRLKLQWLLYLRNQVQKFVVDHRGPLLHLLYPLIECRDGYRLEEEEGEGGNLNRIGENGTRGILGVTTGLARVGGTVGGGTVGEGGRVEAASGTITGESSGRDRGRERDQGRGKDPGRDQDQLEGEEMIGTLVHLRPYLRTEEGGTVIDPRRFLLVVHPHLVPNIVHLLPSNLNLVNPALRLLPTLVVLRLPLLPQPPNYLRQWTQNMKMLFHSAHLLSPNTTLLLVPHRHNLREHLRRPEMHPRFRSLELREGCWAMETSLLSRRKVESNYKLREVLRDLEIMEGLSHRE